MCVGENIFTLMDSALKNAGLNWTRCLALGCDNANVMVGEKNGVLGHIKKKHKEVFLAGCTLHIIHNAARKAATDYLPPFEDVLTDTFYYFKKSSNRLERFKGEQDFCGIEQKRMLKHVCTRWLSISRLMDISFKIIKKLVGFVISIYYSS